MSLRVVNAVGTGTAQPGFVPCLGDRFGTSGPSWPYGQSGVRANESLQIVFRGKPPYNLTQTICEQGSCWCGTTITNLTTNTFNWTVASIKSSFSTVDGQPRNLLVPGSGQSVIWIAIEQNQSSAFSTPYHSSPNFSYATTSYDTPASAGKLRLAVMGLQGLLGCLLAWLMAWATVVGV